MADKKPLVNSAGNAVEIATGDTIPVANGGTGATTLAANGVVIGNGAGAVNVATAGTAGQVLTSNGAGADPTFQAPGGTSPVSGGVVSADQSVTSSTTLVDATGLGFAAGANETWAFIASVRVSAGASGGFKFLFTVPSGAGGYCSTQFGGALNAADTNITTGSGMTAAIATGTNGQIQGYVTTSSTAGNVQMQFAQNASNGTATTIKRGSILAAWRVG